MAAQRPKYYICKNWTWVKYIKIENGVPYAWTIDNSRWQPIYKIIHNGSTMGYGYGEPHPNLCQDRTIGYGYGQPNYLDSLCHCNHKQCVETDTEYHGPDTCPTCGIDLVCPKCGIPYCISNEHNEVATRKDIKYFLGQRLDKLAVLVLIGEKI